MNGQKEPKHQVLPQENLRCTAWTQSDFVSIKGGNFVCEDPSSSLCNAKSFTDLEIESYSNFLASLELLGIPQVHIDINIENNSNSCSVDPDDDGFLSDTFLDYEGDSVFRPIPGTVLQVNSLVSDSINFAIPEYQVNNKAYFSANDMTNFDTNFGLKKIFEPDKFACCLPAGETFVFEVEDSMCCTGQAEEVGSANVNGVNIATSRCCLPSYTNVSVYLNRYVSSQAKDLDYSLFDPLTGMLPAAIVQQSALRNNLCCSGNSPQYGVAISDQLPVPGDTTNSNESRRRFNYTTTDLFYNFYTEGQRWNTNIYCVPNNGAGAGGNPGGNAGGNAGNGGAGTPVLGT